MSPIDEAAAKELLELAEAEQVHFVRLQFTDILGIPKNVEVPVSKFAEVLEKNIAFDGSSIEGFARIFESDMYLRPDPATFAIYPWGSEHVTGPLAQLSNGNRKTARLVCDVVTPDESPYAGDPRYALRRAVAKAAEMGYTAYAGPEAEFFLLHTDAAGAPTLETHDIGGYFDAAPLDLGEDVRKDIVLALTAMGFDVEAAHHEVAAGQHEIDFRYGEILETADRILTFKLVTKTVANLQGLHATFMPKPIQGQNGSGMHTHLSLFNEDGNAFYDPEAQYNLSSTAHQFMAGLIAHIHAITAVANPTVNSYKRLVPGYEAPVNISWARKNRSALIRIPDTNTPETSTRVELRCPDPACNPYLAFAAILSAGLDGIERGLEPPQPVEEDIYEMTDEERIAREIDTLPGSLDEALDSLEADPVVLAALGEHVAEKFVQAKRSEAAEARLEVTPWELAQYLAVL